MAITDTTKKEYVLGTNKFKVPGYYEGAKAYALNVIRLLLMNPGTNPLHPAMGVGLGPKYRFIMEDDLYTLTERIEDQCNTYLPGDYGSKVNVDTSISEDNYLSIIITANNTKIQYDTKDSDTPIEVRTAFADADDNTSSSN